MDCTTTQQIVIDLQDTSDHDTCMLEISCQTFICRMCLDKLNLGATSSRTFKNMQRFIFSIPTSNKFPKINVKKYVYR